LTNSEANAVMESIIRVARAIDRAFERPGIAVWQNNGVPAHQAIPHVHFHVAGTLPGGGTAFGPVRELTIEETDLIAQRLKPFLEPSEE
jgi:histidine triad (HIT) family protein